MRVMHEVTCCNDCPLFAGAEDSGDGWPFCQHPSTHAPQKIRSDEAATAPPSCPLRKGELLITLRVKS